MRDDDYPAGFHPGDDPDAPGEGSKLYRAGDANDPVKVRGRLVGDHLYIDPADLAAVRANPDGTNAEAVEVVMDEIPSVGLGSHPGQTCYFRADDGRYYRGALVNMGATRYVAAYPVGQVQRVHIGTPGNYSTTPVPVAN